jgi:hypothetical protein
MMDKVQKPIGSQCITGVWLMKFTVMEITKQYHTIENTDHKLTLKEI